MTDKWMDEVGSDVLKAVDDGVERCFLIALLLFHLEGFGVLPLNSRLS